jgi:hypothetical protein
MQLSLTHHSSMEHQVTGCNVFHGFKVEHLWFGGAREARERERKREKRDAHVKC